MTDTSYYKGLYYYYTFNIEYLHLDTVGNTYDEYINWMKNVYMIEIKCECRTI